MVKINENSINEFLWYCAGVNKDVLRLYPSEYAKYAGSGGTILFTALMAMISGGYAMYFVFSNFIVAVIFAIFWGLLIFNLDRFIVNSMHTDGKDTISWKKLKAASPRIIMAIFLGLVISTPLEMKIFNDRIESLLLKDNIERVNEAKNSSSDYSALNELTKEQTALSKERLKLVTDLLTALKDLKEEAEGNALSGISGHGTIYKDKEVYVNQCKQSLADWDNLHKERLNTLQKRIDEVNAHVAKFEDHIDGLKEDGFSARYEAFSNLREENSSLNTVSVMITMLFIIIEITPTFFKLIMTSGPYDEHVGILNYKVEAFIRKEKDDIDTSLTISSFDNLQKLKVMTLLVIQKEIPQALTLDETPKIFGAVHILDAVTVPESEEPEIKLKSNTTIITLTKKTSQTPYKKNSQGQLVLNFTTKHK